MSEGLIDAALSGLASGSENIVERAKEARARRYDQEDWQRQSSFTAEQNKQSREAAATESRLSRESTEEQGRLNREASVEQSRLDRESRERIASGKSAPKAGTFKFGEDLEGNVTSIRNTATGEVIDLNARAKQIIEETPEEEKDEGFFSQLWNSLSTKPNYNRGDDIRETRSISGIAGTKKDESSMASAAAGSEEAEKGFSAAQQNAFDLVKQKYPNATDEQIIDALRKNKATSNLF